MMLSDSQLSKLVVVVGAVEELKLWLIPAGKHASTRKSRSTRCATGLPGLVQQQFVCLVAIIVIILLFVDLIDQEMPPLMCKLWGCVMPSLPVKLIVLGRKVDLTRPRTVQEKSLTSEHLMVM